MTSRGSLILRRISSMGAYKLAKVLKHQVTLLPLLGLPNNQANLFLRKEDSQKEVPLSDQEACVQMMNQQYLMMQMAWEEMEGLNLIPLKHKQMLWMRKMNWLSKKDWKKRGE